MAIVARKHFADGLVRPKPIALHRPRRIAIQQLSQVLGVKHRGAAVVQRTSFD